MIQGDLRVLVGPEAIRFSCRDSRLVVEALGGAVGEHAAGSDPVEKLVSMLPKGRRELLERLETGTHGHGRPAGEELLGPGARVVAPEVVERLLEQVGADGAEVDGDQLSESATLVDGEVLPPLEQEPASLREQHVQTRGSQCTHLVTANGVDRLAEQLHDVEAVQDMDGRAAIAYDLEERLPHVARHEHDGLGALVAQHVEEAVEGRRRSLLCDVK